MTAIKVKKKHLRYLALATVLGIAQIYRSLTDDAVPFISDGYSTGTYLINKTGNIVSSIEPDETTEYKAGYIVISNNRPSNSTFSMGVFSKNNSSTKTPTPSTSQDSHGNNNNAIVENNTTIETPSMAYEPVIENSQARVTGTFTKQLSSIGKFASSGMASGGEEVLVPNPPPEPDETPLDSFSFTILLIGLVIGSVTILKAKKQEQGSVG